MYMQRHLDVITHPAPLSTIKELIHPLHQMYKYADTLRMYKYADTLRMHKNNNKVFEDKNVHCCVIKPYLKTVVHC